MSDERPPSTITEVLMENEERWPEKRVFPHSGLVSFYDAAHDFGVDVLDGVVSVGVRGSSELRDMSPTRAIALMFMLRLACLEALQVEKGGS